MTDPSIRVRRAESDADLSTLSAIVNAVTPDEPTSLDEIRWQQATYPGGVWFLGDLDGEPVGAASVGRIFIYPPEYDALWSSMHVLPDHRRRGLGSALLAAVSDVARERGKEHLESGVMAHRPEAITFLEHRGFKEVERSKMVRLALAGLRIPEVALADGLDLVTLADRPDLLPGIHAVALETFPDIPSADEPVQAGDFDEFRARDIDRIGAPHDACFIAVDQATGEAVGYANLLMAPGRTDLAWHDMTAVRRAWRGKGIATALKVATIRWAIEHGLTALDTGNDVANGPMRTVNARLGYQPLPDEIVLRGPVVQAQVPA